MKTVIIYYSKHHGNTEKLIQAIAATNDVTLIDCTKVRTIELSQYDRIGFASGIYYHSFAKPLLKCAAENLPQGKAVFFIATCGAPRKNYFTAIRRIAQDKHCIELGPYRCRGFDTFGPFRLIGGIAKGHPTEKEIADAVAFYNALGT